MKSFQQALKQDPEWAPAHAGLGRALAEDDPPAAAAEAGQALEIDPHLADAQLLLAELDLDNTRWDSARESIARVLADNPSHLEARALAAAITYVRQGRAPFDAEVKPVLAINPSYGEIYRVAAELSARNYRFDEAVGLAREAIALDPTNARAHAELGMHLMRTGDEGAARQSLDRAFKIDPYDVVTYNLLSLLDTLDKFVEIREGDIILKLDPDEAPVMREYAMPLAQEALKTLSAKYHFTPKGPILVEIFPRHDDFAVRTLGLPGHDWRARRVLRPGRLARLAPCRRQATWIVLVAGDAVARDDARHHAPDVESAYSAMAHGRHLRIRGDAGASRLGARDGDSLRDGARAGQDPEACGPQLGVHPAGHDRAGVLRSVAPR